MALGEAVRIQPETFLKEMNEVDFVGYPMNCAARMQSLSGAYGTTLCSGLVRLIGKEPESFLYPDTPSFRRLFIPPSAKALERAKNMQGLTDADRIGFMHLTWPDCQRKLWRKDGTR